MAGTPSNLKLAKNYETCYIKSFLFLLGINIICGPLSMDNKIPVAGIEQLVEVCRIHSANKQFF